MQRRPPISTRTDTRLPYTTRCRSEDWFVWDSTPILGEDGKIHVFFSRWPDEFGNWLSHSEIAHAVADKPEGPYTRSEEHTSELQSLMRISYAVFCLKKQHNSRYVLAHVIPPRLHSILN